MIGKGGWAWDFTVIQWEFCDIFIFSLIYSGCSIWKQISLILFFRLKFEVRWCSFFLASLISIPKAFSIVFKSKNDLPKSDWGSLSPSSVFPHSVGPSLTSEPDSLILHSVFPPGYTLSRSLPFSPTCQFICSFSYVLVHFANNYYLPCTVLGADAQHWIKQCSCPHVYVGVRDKV